MISLVDENAAMCLRKKCYTQISKLEDNKSYYFTVIFEMKGGGRIVTDKGQFVSKLESGITISVTH